MDEFNPILRLGREKSQGIATLEPFQEETSFFQFRNFSETLLFFSVMTPAFKNHCAIKKFSGNPPEDTAGPSHLLRAHRNQGATLHDPSPTKLSGAYYQMS